MPNDETHRCADPEPASRFGVQASHREFRFFGVGDDSPGPVEIGLTDFGQVEAPRRPVQQARAQALLQPRQLFADGGLGEAQITGRGGETAALCDPGEDGDAGEMVHGGALLL